MPRTPRIQYPGAFYHFMARGNRRENIVLGYLDPVRAGMIKQGQGFDESPWTNLREYRKPPTERQPWMATSSGFEAVGLEETSRGRLLGICFLRGVP